MDTAHPSSATNPRPSAARRLGRPALIGAALLATLLAPSFVAARPSANGDGTATAHTAGASEDVRPGEAPHARRSAPSAARPSARRAAAPAADTAARAPITLTVGGLSFAWRTLPGTAVTAELRAGAVVKARGAAESDRRGRLHLYLGADADGVAMEAGDVLRFKADGLDDIWSVTVPTLAADVDADADVVFGRAPSGSTVSVAVHLRENAALDHFANLVAEDGGRARPHVPPSVERQATAGPDGAMRVDLAGDADVRPGDVVTLALADGVGDTFVALAAATQVWLPPGQDWALATATLGTTVTLTVLAPDGETRIVLRGRAFASDHSASIPLAYLHAVDDSETGEESEEGDPLVPLVGDTLVLARSAGLASQRVTTATLPTLSIAGLDRDGTVRGAGPPGTALAARLYGPFGEAHDATVAPTADGSFAAPAGTVLGPGWRAVVVWTDPGGFATGVIGVVPQVRARVGATVLAGVGWPGRPVTVTLRSGTARLGSWSDVASENGRFRIALVDRDPDGTPSGAVRRLAPGMSVEVEFDDGDPVVVGIVELTTVTDPDRETVSGTAPPGAALTLTIMRPAGGDADGDAYDYDYRLDDRIAVTAGLDGRWTVDGRAAAGPDRPAIDIEPPLWGEVVFVRPDGHFIVRSWAPIRIDAVLGFGFAWGFGPPGEEGALTLRDAAGNVIVQRRIEAESAPWDMDRPLWYAGILDPLDKEVPTAAGDTLEVTIGGTVSALVYPPIEAASHVADDRVTGRTSPELPIDLEVWTPNGTLHSAADVAEVDGAFVFDLAPRLDLVYNASVWLNVHVGRHRVGHIVDVPGLSVDLDHGVVSGSAEPDLAVTLTLERAGRAVVRQRIFTDRYGSFEADLVGADPRVDRPVAGDVIILAAPGARYIEPRITMAVPELTIDLPRERDHVRGRFDPSGSLAVELWTYHSNGHEPETTHLVTGADGRWRLDWSNPTFRLDAGWTAHATIQQPSGHQAYRSRTVPRLDLRLGSSVACGTALPDAPVRLSVDGPAGTGGAAATSTAAGRFRADLVDASRAPRPIAAGDQVTVDLGGWPATLTVPRLDLITDWANAVITGTTTPSATLMLAAWRGDCTANGDGGIEWSNWTGTAAADGGFSAPIPDSQWWDDRRFAVVVSTPDGHRVFQPLAAVGITARPDTAEALGFALPEAPLTATLHAPDGRLRAAADGAVSPDGTWAVAFASNGTPVRMRDGDRLSVGAGGSAASIIVEALAFDFDSVRGLMGTARPMRSVTVLLGLATADRRHYDSSEEYLLTADASGAFAIGAPPPRARWSFADVRSVRATVRLTDGHVLESRLDLAPPSPPHLYLPVAHRR